MSVNGRGVRMLTTSDAQQNIHGLGKEHSAKLIALAKDQRKTPKKYLEDLLDYYYIYL
jgi:hypothetical protein|tara:strand:+ start:334 stop:507 length:174 start_codon:yes stop_codon:yes gene_type:complete